MAKELCVIYLHPCSTNTLVYIIPKKFDDILKNDDAFKIGYYRAPFKECLNSYYDNDRHKDSYFYKKPFIRTVMEVELDEEDICDIPYNGYTETSKGEKKHAYPNNKDIYYYELCSWSLDGPHEWQRFLERTKLGTPIKEGEYKGIYEISSEDFLI